MDIKELRKNIDSVDEKLVTLIRERMELSAKIGEYKRENKLPVYDSPRERELFDRVGEMAGEELASYTRVLYSTMTDVSRSYQRKLLGRNGALSERMQKAIEETVRALRVHIHSLPVKSSSRVPA